MSVALHLIWRILLMILVFGLLLWLFYRELDRSENRIALVLRWVLSAGIIAYLIWKVSPLMDSADPNTKFSAIAQACVCGLVLAVFWRGSIGALVARPFESLYSGGETEVEPKPFYSVARSKRSRGHYDEAIREIRRQLDRFPTDVDGQMMLAEIQAENMFDLPAAETTVQRLCAHPDHPPRAIAYALNSLADWRLKFAQDRDGARDALQQIIVRLPGSELAARAAQRIAHLAQTSDLLAPHDRRKIVVTHGVENLGLLAAGMGPRAPEADPAQEATDHVAHLEQHPLDTEIREKLAVIYANHYGRLDLAGDQLEQLISHPGQSPKRVVHWLNALADLQIKHQAPYETVRATLQRIVDLFPDLAAAQIARNRMDHLKLELKAHHEGGSIKLGTYEQDLGLKGKAKSPDQL